MSPRDAIVRRRFEEFPQPIQEIGHHNPFVRRVMDMYAHGQIVTFEEALCQMIVELSTDREKRTRELMDLHMRATTSPFQVAPWVAGQND